jgi:peroxiredoxin
MESIFLAHYFHLALFLKDVGFIQNCRLAPGCDRLSPGRFYLYHFLQKVRISCKHLGGGEQRGNWKLVANSFYHLSALAVNHRKTNGGKSMKPISVSSIGPVFTLEDNRGDVVELSSFSGKKVLLAWHPLAWTRVCAAQMQALEENWTEFEKLNTIPLGLSIDPYPSKNAWAKELGISKVKLLSDFWPHGKVASDYGIFRQVEGFSERANIILSETGKVLWVKIYDIPQLPDLAEVLAVLKS